MGLVFTGNPPRTRGPIIAEVPTPNYSGLSDDNASTSINPYTGQGPGAGGVGQTASEVALDRAGGPATDPNFANVVLLMHLDSDFTDSSNSGHTFASTGSPVISSDQSKFGGSSLSLNGSSWIITTNAQDDWDFGLDDFTIEYFLYPHTNPDFIFPLSTVTATAVGGWWTEYGTRGFIFGTTGTVVLISASHTISINTWHHIAYVRDSGTMRYFVDGVQISSDSSKSAVAADTSDTNGLAIGNLIPGVGDFPVDGFMDELRITKGVAIYTANFTPPTEAFPDS